MRTKKEYLLGIDVTPRRALYAEIESLNEEVERILKEKNCLYKELTKLNIELDNAYAQIKRMRPKRGHDGRFVKRNK